MFLYIDPGMGSMLTQAVVAGVLAFVMFFKQLKYQVMNFFKNHRKPTDLQEGE